MRTCIDFFPFEEAILQEVSSMSTENLLRSLLPIGLASAFDFGVLRNICKARLTNEPSIINSSWHNFISVRWVWLLLGADSQKWHKFLRSPFIREAEIIVVGRTAWGHSNAIWWGEAHPDSMSSIQPSKLLTLSFCFPNWETLITLPSLIMNNPSSVCSIAMSWAE